MIIRGDCVEAMRELPEASVDAVVTDPPYGLEFMGKEWDNLGRNSPPSFEHSMQDNFKGFKPLPRPGGLTLEGMHAAQRWHHAWATECLRVLKPGGHLLAFGGTRTYHRLACAIEDAGFEIRDCLAWLYGSGFPKSLNLNGEHSGWGTALKPAHEPIVLARKPLTGTVASNVERYGCGALNIDGTRLDAGNGGGRDGEASAERRYTERGSTDFAPLPGPRGGDALGRWPANVLLDSRAAELLDEQSGERPGPGGPANSGSATAWPGGAFQGVIYPGETGGASRFFYTAKASRAERNAGLEGFAEQDGGCLEGNADMGNARKIGARPDLLVATTRNHHPTVKPIDLMRWLCRLVTPPGGHVLDPFAGSGTTGIACVLEGFTFTGIEREAEYADIAEARIAYWLEHGEKALLAMYEAERRRVVAETGQLAMTL